MSYKDKVEHVQLNLENIYSLLNVVYDNHFADKASTLEHGRYGDVVLVCLEKIGDLQEDIYDLFDDNDTNLQEID